VLEGLRVASQGEIGAPDVVQRVPDTMREAAISECAVRLVEARDGLLGPAQVEERLAQVVQGDALAVSVPRLPVQLQGPPEQIESLVLTTENHVGVGQIVRRLRLSMVVTDLAPDGEGPLEVGNALGLTRETEGLAQVVQHPRLALAVARLARALHRD